MTADLAATYAIDNELDALADNKRPRDLYAAQLAALANASTYADTYNVDRDELRALLEAHAGMRSFPSPEGGH